MARVQFTTRLEEKLLKDIKKLAIDLDCSVNDIIEYCLKSFLKSPGQQKEVKKDTSKCS
jgi:hypothetical protein